MQTGTYRFKLEVDITMENKFGDMRRKELLEMLKDALDEKFAILASSDEFRIRLS